MLNSADGSSESEQTRRLRMRIAQSGESDRPPALIKARTGDGLEAPITYTPVAVPEPGYPRLPRSPLRPRPGWRRCVPSLWRLPAILFPDGPSRLTSEAVGARLQPHACSRGTTQHLRSAAETEIGPILDGRGYDSVCAMVSRLANDYNLGTRKRRGC